MYPIGKAIGRREFLKRGIGGGALIGVFPGWKAIHSCIPKNSRDESHRKLLKIVKKYGAEFGDHRGEI
jgi:hypothetical protein